MSSDRWKGAGACPKPNGMRFKRYVPDWYVNIVISFSLGVVGTCHYPEMASNAEKIEFSVDAVIHAKDRVRVAYSDKVEPTVIDAETPGSIWIWGENDSGSLFALHRFDDVLFLPTSPRCSLVFPFLLEDLLGKGAASMLESLSGALCGVRPCSTPQGVRFTCFHIF